MRPTFLVRDVSDDELQADLAALARAAYPRLRLIAEARYAATQELDGSLVLCDFWRLWLDDSESGRITITLRRLPDTNNWCVIK